MGKLCGFHPAPFAEVARSSGSCGQPPQGYPYVTPTPAVKPGLPSPAGKPPMAGNSIKHDGFCVIARKDGERIKLYSRSGNDLTGRFPRWRCAHARASSMARRSPATTTAWSVLRPSATGAMTRVYFCKPSV